MVDKEILAIRRAWNAGLRLREAFDRASSLHGMTDKSKAAAEWRKMHRLFGCGCADYSYVNGTGRRPTINGKDLSEDYLRWRGDIGEGLLLREIIKNAR